MFLVVVSFPFAELLLEKLGLQRRWRMVSWVRTNYRCVRISCSFVVRDVHISSEKIEPEDSTTAQFAEVRFQFNHY